MSWLWILFIAVVMMPLAHAIAMLISYRRHHKRNPFDERGD
jgi:hypothetical protein